MGKALQASDATMVHRILSDLSHGRMTFDEARNRLSDLRAAERRAIDAAWASLRT